MIRKGLVTGGLYGSQDGCQPYVLKPCEHHVNGTRGIFKRFIFANAIGLSSYHLDMYNSLDCNIYTQRSLCLASMGLNLYNYQGFLEKKNSAYIYICNTYSVDLKTSLIQGPCEEGGRTPKCHHYCENKSYNTKYKDDLTHGQKAYSMPEKPKDIMVELMTNGPVEAAFTVFADFPNYKSGVYQHVSGSALG